MGSEAASCSLMKVFASYAKFNTFNTFFLNTSTIRDVLQGKPNSTSTYTSSSMTNLEKTFWKAEYFLQKVCDCLPCNN